MFISNTHVVFEDTLLTTRTSCIMHRDVLGIPTHVYI